jgi:hypothetical protein
VNPVSTFGRIVPIALGQLTELVFRIGCRHRATRTEPYGPSERRLRPLASRNEIAASDSAPGHTRFVTFPSMAPSTV